MDKSIHTEPIFAGFVVVQMPRFDVFCADNRHTTNHFTPCLAHAYMVMIVMVDLIVYVCMRVFANL